MTNSDFLNALVPEVPQGIKTAVMVARGVDPAATYDGSKPIELAEADLYMRIILMPDFTEGRLSVKYDRDALEKQANGIYKKHKDPRYDDGQPLVRRVRL